MLGMDYLLPVTPVVRYHSQVDELMVPTAEIPTRDIVPWQTALERLVSDRAHYEQLSARIRARALDYARPLDPLPLEAYLLQIVEAPRRRPGAAGAHQPQRDRRKLLALRLKK